LRKKELMEFTSQPKIKIIYKNENGENIVEMIVLEPEIEDKQHHIISADIISQGKELWDSQSPVLGIEHRNKKLELYPLQDFNPNDKQWLSSWNEDFKILNSIIVPQDMTLGSLNQRVKRGSWVLSLEVLSDEIWQKIQNNELTGASIGALGLLGNENSHQRIFELLPLEISLVERPAIGRTFLTKALEILRKPISGWHSCRLKNPETMQADSFKTIEQELKDGRKVNIIIARPKGKGKEKTTAQAIRYPVEQFTEEESRRRCLEKSGTFEPAKEE